MFFEDIFYPDNPARREKVRTLQNSMLNTLDQFQKQWNALVAQINPIFASLPDQDASWRYSFLTVQYNSKVDSLNTCIERINSVALDAKHKVEKLITDVGLTESLPADWHLDASALQKVQDTILKGLGIGVPLVVSAVVAAVVKGAVQLIALWAGLGRVMTFAVSYGGALLFSTVAFVITDVVISAITGAIERKELESSIALLEQADREVREPLSDATVKIGAVSMQFKDGMFKLDEDHVLMRKKDGSWTVMTL